MTTKKFFSSRARTVLFYALFFGIIGNVFSYNTLHNILNYEHNKSLHQKTKLPLGATLVFNELPKATTNVFAVTASVRAVAPLILETEMGAASSSFAVFEVELDAPNTTGSSIDITYQFVEVVGAARQRKNATVGVDYAGVSTGTVTILNNQQSVSFSRAILPDDLFELTERIQVELTAITSTDPTAAIDATPAFVDIQDNITLRVTMDPMDRHGYEFGGVVVEQEGDSTEDATAILQVFSGQVADGDTGTVATVALGDYVVNSGTPQDLTEINIEGTATGTATIGTGSGPINFQSNVDLNDNSFLFIFSLADGLAAERSSSIEISTQTDYIVERQETFVPELTGVITFTRTNDVLNNGNVNFPDITFPPVAVSIVDEPENNNTGFINEFYAGELAIAIETVASSLQETDDDSANGRFAVTLGRDADFRDLSRNLLLVNGTTEDLTVTFEVSGTAIPGTGASADYAITDSMGNPVVLTTNGDGDLEGTVAFPSLPDGTSYNADLSIVGNTISDDNLMLPEAVQLLNIEVNPDSLLEGPEPIQIVITDINSVLPLNELDLVNFFPLDPTNLPTASGDIADEAGVQAVILQDAASITNGTEPGGTGNNGTFIVQLQDASGDVLTNGTGDDIDIMYEVLTGESDDATAGAGNDFTTTGTVTIEDGESQGIITISVLDDIVIEGTENVRVRLRAGMTSPANILTEDQTPAVLQILDNDSNTVTVSATTDTAVEGGANGVFTVDLGNNNTSDVTVNYMVSGSATPTGEANPDYTAIGSSVTVMANDQTATIDVNALTDQFLEGNETVTITLTSTSDTSSFGIDTNSDTATVTIDDINDDGTGSGAVFATIPTGATNLIDGDEAGPDAASFVVALRNSTNFITNATGENVSVTFEVLATGTATATGPNADYTITSTTAVIPSGESRVRIPVTVLDDFALEGTETIIVALETGTATTVAPDINFASNNTATRTLNIADDETDGTGPEGDITALILATNASNRGNETGPDPATFTVQLQNGNNQPITNGTGVGIDIGYRIFPTGATNEATEGDDFTTPGTVTIATGASVGTITLTVIDDNVMEGDEEVRVQLTDTPTPPSNSNIAIDAQDRGTLIIDNDNGVSNTVSISSTVNPGDDTAVEGGADGVFTIDLGIVPATDVRVNYIVSGSATPTGEANPDYTAIGSSIIITSGNQTGTIVIDAAADDVLEGNETVIVTLNSTDNALIGITTTTADATATVTIDDNEDDNPNPNPEDTVSVVILNGVGDIVDGSEPGGAGNNGTFTVALRNANNDAITNGTGDVINVNYNATGASTATEDLDFTTDDFTTIANNVSTGTITITVLNDAILESPDETVTVALTGNDGTNVGTDTTARTLNIIDDDGGGSNDRVFITATTDTAVEGGADGVFTIDLGVVPATDVRVNYTINIDPNTGQAINGTDYAMIGSSLSSGSIDFTTGNQTGTIVIDAATDLFLEGDETVIVTLDSTDNALFGIDTTRSVATVTIDDANDNGGDPMDDPLESLVAVIIPSETVNGAEPSTNGTFTVELQNGNNDVITNSTGESISIGYTVGGTAMEGVMAGDPDFTTEAFAIADDESRGDIIITVGDDLLIEGNETVEVTLNATTTTMTAGGDDIIVNGDNEPDTLIIDDNEDNVNPNPQDNVSVVILNGDGDIVDGNETGPMAGSFTVQLQNGNNQVVTNATGGPIRVNYTTVNPSTTAEIPDDFTTGNFTTIANNASTGDITIAVVDDTDLEGNEIVEVRLTSNNGTNIATDPTLNTLTIIDNDNTGSSDTVFITASTDMAEEGGANGQFTIDLGVPNTTGSPVVVNYTIATGDGQAIGIEDYRFNVGAHFEDAVFNSKAFSYAGTDFTLTDDLVINGFDNFSCSGTDTGRNQYIDSNDTSVSVSGVIGSIVAQGGATFSVSTTQAQCAFTSNDGGNSSSTGTIRFIGTLADNSTIQEDIIIPTSANINTLSSFMFDDGIWGGVELAQLTLEIVSGADYFAMDNLLFDTISTSVAIREGEQTATIDVIASTDQLLEGEETVTLTLTNTSRPALLDIDNTRDTATVTIDDANDNVGPTTLVAISASTDGSEGDPIVNGAFTVSLVDGAGNAVTNSTGDDITIDYTLGGTASEDDDYRTIMTKEAVIVDGASTGTVTIEVLNDFILEGNETVEVTLTNANFSGVGVIGADVLTGLEPTAMVTIDDANDNGGNPMDDPLESLVAVITGSDNGAEPGGTGNNGSFTVTLQNGNGDVIINSTGSAVEVGYMVAGGTATQTDDYTTGSLVSIVDGASTGDIVIAVEDDNEDEGDETVDVTLDAMTTTTTAIGDIVVNADNTIVSTLTIADDNDGAGVAIVSIEATDNTAIENNPDDGLFTITLGVANTSGQDVIVNYAIATGTGQAINGTDYAMLEDSDLIFNTGSVAIPNNEQTATIVIDALEDLVLEGEETVTLTLQNAGNSLVIYAIDASNNSAMVTIDDANDNGGNPMDDPLESLVAVILPSVTVDGAEPSTNGTFTVQLQNGNNEVIINSTGSAVEVGYMVTGGTATITDDYTTTSPVSIADGASTGDIEIEVEDDNEDEGDETVQVTLDAMTTTTTLIGDIVVNGDNTPDTLTIVDDNDGCSTPATITLVENSGETCEDTDLVVRDNQFGGGATTVTVTSDGAGTVSQTIDVANSMFDFIYTPDASDIGNTVTITVTSDDPDGVATNCTATVVTYTLDVIGAPTPGTITAPVTVCVSQSVSITTSGTLGGVWTSTNPSVATIDSSGVITGIADGTTTIVYTVSVGNCTPNSSTVEVNVGTLDSDGDGTSDCDEINPPNPPGGGDPPPPTDPMDPCDAYDPDNADLDNPIFAEADCDGDGITNEDEINPPTPPGGGDPPPPTDPFDPDTDGDGTPDDEENDPPGDDPPTDPTDPCDGVEGAGDITDPDFAEADCDGDGITNEDEINPPPPTDPFDPDTDGDGTPDGEENDPPGDDPPTDPTDPCDGVEGAGDITDPDFAEADCDGDGITNEDEINPPTPPGGGDPPPPTDPFDPDTDGDGTPDGEENDPPGDDPPTDPTDPCDGVEGAGDITDPDFAEADCDGDGITNEDEINPPTPPGGGDPPPPTDPFDPDTDGDGTPDGEENDPPGDDPPTDPTDPCDGVEGAGDITDPDFAEADCDGDGITNEDEINPPTPPGGGDPPPPTDPYDPDTDGDGTPDGEENDPPGDDPPTDPTDPCDGVEGAGDITDPDFAEADCDGDGITNEDEINPPTPPGGGDPPPPTDPYDPDTDGDGTPDGEENDPPGDDPPTDPTDPCDGVEGAGDITDPDFAEADCDGDGITNEDEINPPTPPGGGDPPPPTDPFDPDTDGDGTPDGEENDPPGDDPPTDPTNPCDAIDVDNADLDDPGFADIDCDGDGLTNAEEIDPDGDGTPGPGGTDPMDPDTDGDGSNDADEIDPDGDGVGPNDPNGPDSGTTDPNDPCSFDTEDVTLPVTSTVECIATIKITKTADVSGGIELGDDIIYTITVENTGGLSISGLQLEDTITDFLGNELQLSSLPTFESASEGSAEGELIAGEIATYTATFTINEQALNAGGVSNTVIGSAIGTDNQVVMDISDDGDDLDGNLVDDPTETELGCLIVFNLFSPNGDGINDKFVINCIENYPNNNLQVYNRWGSVVYRRSGYNNEFDGIANTGSSTGKGVLPVGTYYYVLDLGDGSEPIVEWFYINQ